MSIFTGPGKGRKKCIACEKYVGVRSRFCTNCGNPFPKPKKTKGAVVGYIPNPPKRKCAKIWVNSGNCPIKIRSFDKESVLKWAREVQELEFKNDKHLMAHALRHYLRQFLDPLSEEYKTASSYITDEEFD